MFGIDSLLSTLEGLFKKIQEFFTLSQEKGVGGAIGTMAENSFNAFTKQAEATINSIPATFERGSKLFDQLGSLASGTPLPAETTAGPEGSAPAPTPPAPAATTPTQHIS